MINDLRLVKLSDQLRRGGNRNPQNWFCQAPAPGQSSNLGANYAAIQRPCAGGAEEWQTRW